MTSDIQLKANQQNASLGGVKTEEGKEKSKFNALKHGILRESFTDYEKDFYPDIYNDLVEQYQPIGVTEQILVERIAIYYLKLFRVQKTETEFMKSKLDPRYVKEVGFPNPLDSFIKYEVVNEGHTPTVTEDNVLHLMGTFTRYETTLENRFYRAIHELERIQRFRKGEHVAAPVAIDLNEMGSFGEKGKIL